MHKNTLETIEDVIEDELYNGSPNWLPYLAEALGVTEPLNTGLVTLENNYTIDRALIRIVLVLCTFKEMMSVSNEDILDMVHGLLPVVDDKTQYMEAAIQLKWQKHLFE